MPPFVVAQYNIVWLIAPLDDPRLADFNANVARLNSLADSSPGFVWRYQTPTGDSLNARVRGDARILVNMSAWETVEDLHRFSFRSDHATVFRRRKEWFTHEDTPFAVLWWIPRDHRPDLVEAEDRLRRLKEQGPSPEAFTFKRRFPAPAPRSEAGDEF